MVGFLFGGSTGLSYQDLQSRREAADALAKRIMGMQPRNVPEGIGALLTGVAAGIGRHQANKGMKEGRDAATGQFNKLFSQITGQPIPDNQVQGTLLPNPGAAAEMAATDPTPASFSGNQQEFIDAILPAAIEEGRRTGVDPRIIIAQAAQETGWGRSAPGNNLFGIKSHGQSGGNSLMTTEYVNGRPVKVRDSFRAYEDPADSVRGYGDFILSNPRYEKFRTAQSLDEQLAALQASGYATDPNYSRSVGSIARGIQIPHQVASLDPSAGMSASAAIEQQAPGSGYVDPMVSAPNSQQAYVQPQQGAGALPPLPSREVASPPPVASAPQQVAQARAPMQSNPFAGIDPQMLQLLNNPFLPEESRQMLRMVIEQQVQANDPVRQMQMRKGQLEIEAAERGQWARLDDGRLYNQRTGEIRMAPADPNTPPSDLGLNPQYGVDENGNPVLLQLGKDGKVVQSQLPEGITLSKEPIRLDAGTHFVLLDPITRQPVGQIPKENYQEAYESASGTAAGKTDQEAQANLLQVISEADQSIALIDEMLTHPGRTTATGMSSILDPRNYLAGTDATDFNTRRKQLEGRAFLQAFNSLRGGGQITEVEGRKATEAIARLNTAQSDEAYVEALTELKNILQAGKDRARQKASGGSVATPSTAPAAAPPAGVASPADPLGLR